MHKKIISLIENGHTNLRGLKQLRIIELRKTSYDPSKQTNTHWSQMTSLFEVLPLTGKIRDFVSQNDLVMFKLDSQDIWIKVSLSLTQESNVIDAELDLKIEKNIALAEFDSLL